ncbi:hypothetical protein [Paenibacillus harenae]|uniref:DUF4306 domain-containing protein n=1 Tax=Paenibacillus harenae TaxID=306543 RepID=A0ABT9TYW6_PAEHA|nr:hypothetical protein [Paenibacillus harenae]MDQ0112558.1 hypothetical protein [Paenibacillus harenae]
MKRSIRLLIEAGIIALITTAAICLFFNFDGYSATIVEQESQSQPIQVINEEMLAATYGHAEIMWVKSPNWQGIMTIFVSVFLIYLLVRSGILWLLSIQSRNNRE